MHLNNLEKKRTKQNQKQKEERNNNNQKISKTEQQKGSVKLRVGYFSSK